MLSSFKLSVQRTSCELPFLQPSSMYQTANYKGVTKFSKSLLTLLYPSGYKSIRRGLKNCRRTKRFENVIKPLCLTLFISRGCTETRDFNCSNFQSKYSL